MVYATPEAHDLKLRIQYQIGTDRVAVKSRCRAGRTGADEAGSSSAAGRTERSGGREVGIR